jgi:hypothetical protein
VQDHHPRIGVAPQDFRGCSPRPVIDNDELEGRECLREYAVDRLTKSSSLRPGRTSRRTRASQSYRAGRRGARTSHDMASCRFRKFWADFRSEAKASSRLRCRVLAEGPSRVTNRPLPARPRAVEFGIQVTSSMVGEEAAPGSRPARALAGDRSCSGRESGGTLPGTHRPRRPWLSHFERSRRTEQSGSTVGW